jgi:hypothetical protein
VHTKVYLAKEDSGRSVQLGVGDLVEVSLSETNPGASWQVEVDADILSPISSPTNTQAVWVLDETDQMHLRTFRAAHTGRTMLTMSYNRLQGGETLSTFGVEIVVGDAPKPKPIRQPVAAPQLLIIMFQVFLMAAAAALLCFRFATVSANVLQEKAQIAQAAEQAQMRIQLGVGQADLLLGLLGTVAMGTIAGYALVRIVAFFAGRLR